MSRTRCGVIVFSKREHYRLVTAEGSIVDRSSLDLEEDAEPVWCRLAEWAPRAWPAGPVRLTDTVDDLGAPCDW